MNQVATLRVVGREPELKIVPLERARAEWTRSPVRIPRRLFIIAGRGSKFCDAVLACVRKSRSSAIRLDQGCLFARPRYPIRRSLISLPFSDFCPPLAVNDSARDSLLSRLAVIQNRPRLELRGVAAGYPWNVLDHFQRWTLDLSRPFQAIEKSRRPRNAASSSARRARLASASSARANAEAMDFFFNLQWRVGAVLEFRHNRLSFFKDGVRGFLRRAIRSKCGSHAPRRGIAAVVVLADGNDLHAKMVGGVAGKSRRRQSFDLHVDPGASRREGHVAGLRPPTAANRGLSRSARARRDAN